MATIEQLITRIESRLALAAGLDVQVGAEDRLIEALRHKYTILFDDFWHRRYMNFKSLPLDGVTGTVAVDLSADIKSFDDINGIYYDQDEKPMPQLDIGTNPASYRTRCVFPNSDPQKVFTVYPLDTTGTVYFWYRTKLGEDVWDTPLYNTEINMDDELLILGTVYDFLVDDGSNQRAEQKFERMFNSRLKQIRDKQWIMPISKTSQATDGPATRWY